MTAEELRAARRRLRLSQSDMAVLCGTTKRNYRRWETGLESIREDVPERIAEAERRRTAALRGVGP